MNGATTSLEEEVHTGRPPEFNQNYTISKHLKVFEQALQSNEEDELGGPAELISAVPDWAPIKVRVLPSAVIYKFSRLRMVAKGQEIH